MTAGLNQNDRAEVLIDVKKPAAETELAARSPQVAEQVDYGAMLGEMRRVFRTGKTRDLAWRKQQLKQLFLLHKENWLALGVAHDKDLGSGIGGALGEIFTVSGIHDALDNLDEWAADKWSEGWIHRVYVRPEPKGVALIIAPWNVPFLLALSPMVAAIAAGNPVVLKPSELAPASAELMKTLVEKYMDPECFKVVCGEVNVCTALLKLRWAHIFFTGGTEVGRIIMKAAAQHLTPVTLELGGKNPCIIDETAQMDATAARVAFGKWANCGQVCIGVDYVLVHESVEKEFLERFKANTLQMFSEDPRNCEGWGKIVAERHVDRLKNLIETSGGEVLLGGAQHVDRAARFVPPTIIYKPNMDSPIMQGETFGPVLIVIPYKNFDDAIRIVQSKETPLAAYIYTQNSANAEKFLTACPSGGAAVNSSFEQVLLEHSPFGGLGESGMGAYHGHAGFKELSHSRTILYKSTLPGFRGSIFPLPDHRKPVGEKELGIITTFIFGIVPMSVKSFFRHKAVKSFFSLTKSTLLFGAAASVVILCWEEFLRPRE